MKSGYTTETLATVFRKMARTGCGIEPTFSRMLDQAADEIEAGQALAAAVREYLAAEEAVALAGISEAGKAIDRSKAAEARLREALHAVDGKGSET